MENIEESLINQQAAEGRYSERESINGIDIEIFWNEDQERYCISFPQIKTGSPFLEKVGVHGQKILLSANPEIAREVFELAVEKAQTVPSADAEEVWLEVWKYCKDFPRPAPRKMAA